MKKRIFVVLVLAIFTAGCAKTAKIRRALPVEAVPEKIAEPASFFTVGERFTYLATWKGIPIGEATATIEELTTFDGHEVYKIVVVARTSKFLSKLFKVEDTFTSYVDRETFTSRHYEANRREGNYRKNLVLDYDFEKRIAIYKNLRDGSVKTCPIEENVQDPVSAAYYFRTIPVRVGDKIKITVNLNEKNYEVFGNIEKRSSVTLPKVGTFDAFLVRPYVRLGGKRLGRANTWGYISTDEKRLCLFVALRILEIPWIGEITATLEKVEYIKN